MGSPVQGQAPAHLRPVSTWGMRHHASLLWRELQVRSQPPSLFHAQASKRFLHLTPFQYAHGCSPLFLPLTSSVHHIQMPCGSALPPQPRRTGSPRCNPPALPSCSKSAVSRVIRKDIIVGKCFLGDYSPSSITVPMPPGTSRAASRDLRGAGSDLAASLAESETAGDELCQMLSRNFRATRAEQRG